MGGEVKREIAKRDIQIQLPKVTEGINRKRKKSDLVTRDGRRRDWDEADDVKRKIRELLVIIEHKWSQKRNDTCTAELDVYFDSEVMLYSIEDFLKAGR